MIKGSDFTENSSACPLICRHFTLQFGVSSSLSHSGLLTFPKADDVRWPADLCPLRVDPSSRPPSPPESVSPCLISSHRPHITLCKSEKSSAVRQTSPKWDFSQVT